MMRQTKYTILRKLQPELLADDVNGLLAEGWQCLGAPFVGHPHSGGLVEIHQAMVLVEPTATSVALSKYQPSPAV